MIYVRVSSAYGRDFAAKHPKVVGCCRIDIIKVNIKAPVTAEQTVFAQVRELFNRVIGCPGVIRIVKIQFASAAFDIPKTVATHMEFRPQRKHKGPNSPEFFRKIAARIHIESVREAKPDMLEYFRVNAVGEQGKRFGFASRAKPIYKIKDRFTPYGISRRSEPRRKNGPCFTKHIYYHVKHLPSGGMLFYWQDFKNLRVSAISARMASGPGAPTVLRLPTQVSREIAS